MKVTTNDGGLNYKITEANLTRDTWYSVNVSKSGYEFNIPNIYVPIPYEPIPVTTKAILSGYFNKVIIEFNYNVPNILISDLTFKPATTVISVTSENMGLTYIVEADLAPNTSYTMSIEKYGYTFSSVKFLTQKEFTNNYSMMDVLNKFGIDSSKFIADVQNFRLLGDTNRIRYLCVPIIDTTVTNTDRASLYGILFCTYAKYGINDWHFLNTPQNLLGGSVWNNRDLSYMSINDYGSKGKVYFLSMIRDDLLDSYTKKQGNLYVCNLDNYVDGKTTAWQELIDEYLWADGDEYDSVNDHEYFLGCGPLVLIDSDNRCRIMGYKFKPYYSDYSDLTSIWNRDIISINPSDESQIWWQSDLTSSQANNYPCSWYIQTSQNMSFTTRASWYRVKTSVGRNPQYYYTMMTSNDMPYFSKPLDYRVGLTNTGRKITPTHNFTRVSTLNNSYSSLSLTNYFPPRIAFDVGLEKFRMSQYAYISVQGTDGEPDTRRGMNLLSMYVNTSDLPQYGLQNPTIFSSQGSSGTKWYPREIVKNNNNIRYGFHAVLNFYETTDGVMVIEDNRPTYSVYYLPISSENEIQFFQSTQFELKGVLTKDS